MAPCLQRCHNRSQPPRQPTHTLCPRPGSLTAAKTPFSGHCSTKGHLVGWGRGPPLLGLAAYFFLLCFRLDPFLPESIFFFPCTNHLQTCIPGLWPAPAHSVPWGGATVLPRAKAHWVPSAAWGLRVPELQWPAASLHSALVKCPTSPAPQPQQHVRSHHQRPLPKTQTDPLRAPAARAPFPQPLLHPGPHGLSELPFLLKWEQGWLLFPETREPQ